MYRGKKGKYAVVSDRRGKRISSKTSENKPRSSARKEIKASHNHLLTNKLKQEFYIEATRAGVPEELLSYAFGQVENIIINLSGKERKNSIKREFNESHKSLSQSEIDSLWDREKYKDRKIKSENPSEFIGRVYRDIIDNGLSTSDFRRRHPITGDFVDIKLYDAFMQWKKYQNTKAKSKKDMVQILRITDITDSKSLSDDPSERAKANLAIALRLARRSTYITKP